MNGKELIGTIENPRNWDWSIGAVCWDGCDYIRFENYAKGSQEGIRCNKHNG